MTRDNDIIRLCTLAGPRTYRMKDMGIEWPPPERIEFMGFGYQRVSMSDLTDEQAQGMTHVCRGAEYESEENRPADSIFGPAST